MAASLALSAVVLGQGPARISNVAPAPAGSAPAGSATAAPAPAARPVATSSGPDRMAPIEASALAAVSADVELTILNPERIDPSVLRDAIARELGAGVRLRHVGIEHNAPSGGRSLVVTLTAKDSRVNVRYQDSASTDGSSSPPSTGVERTIELPDDTSAAIEAIALLTGNLVRDQTSELLSELRRERARPPPHAVESSPAPVEKPKAEVNPTPNLTTPNLTLSPECQLGVFISAWPNDAVFPRHRCDVERLRLDVPYGRTASIRGAQLGLVSEALRDVTGLQATAFWGFVAGELRGVQSSFVSTRARGGIAGVQLAGVVNISERHIKGGQGAGVINLSASVEGGQVALINVASEQLEGAQVGVINKAQQVRGGQFGIVNVATAVKGAQVGLVNIQSEGDGETIGLLNIGQVHPSAWITTRGFVHSALSLGGGHFYSVFTLGLRFMGTPAYDAGAGFGLRASPFESGYVFIDTSAFVRKEADASGSLTFDTRMPDWGMQHRFAGGYRLGRHLALFVGGAIQHDLHGSDYPARVEGLLGIEL